MLVPDSFLVTLSTLLLEDHLHFALGMLDNGSVNFDATWGYYGITAKSVIP
jgi:hypothetical protein